MTVLWIVLILLAIYVFFIAAPAVVSAAAIFSRRDWTDFETLLRPDYQFAPYAKQLRAANRALLQLDSRTVNTDAADGIQLKAEYFDLHAEKTAIFLHGYRSNPMVNFSVQANCFAKHGYNLLIVHQRAHGESDGKTPTLGLLEQEDVLRWVDWAANTAGASEVLLYGMSMGASSVAYASDRLDPSIVKAMILDCGYRSSYEQIAYDCSKRHMPTRLMMPIIRLFARFRLGGDIRKTVTPALSRTVIPAFFLHGTADATVPYSLGRSNFAVCHSRKYFYTADGVGHTMSFPADPEAAEKALFSFLEEDPASPDSRV